MIDINENKKKVLSNIKTNLNIAEIKEGSYLHTTVDGLYNAVKDTLDEVDEISNNFFIDTASEATLERFGNSVGLPRINNKYLGFSEYNKDATLQVDFYKEPQNIMKLFNSGNEVYSGVYVITFTEDVYYDIDLEKNYVYFNIRLLEDFEYNNLILEENQLIELKVPESEKRIVKNLYIKINTSYLFSSNTETIGAYRQRLLSYINNHNILNSNNLENILNIVPELSQYYIDKDVYPCNIYLLNNKMYAYKQMGEDIIYGIIPYINYILNNNKTYGLNFNLLPAVSVPFHLNIRTDFYDKFNESILLEVANTLINEHSLGRAYTINKIVLENILSGLGIDINFNLELYYDYNGVKVPMPQIDNLFIDANSYPLITGITVNEVLEDIS